MADYKDKNIDQANNSETKSRWSSYSNYKLIIWVWMMDETTIVFSPTDISHNGFYIHALLQSLALVFIGIPLLYSEICLAQYTNCDVLTMWNFFPLFRSVGYATIFLIILKTIYLMVLASWYLEYTFFSTFDPPPWYNCDAFEDEKCMVKRINVSIFQHCLEAQLLFDDDCGMKTASNCFFEREIGNNNTSNHNYCFLSWKAMIASSSMSLVLFIMIIKREKFTQIFAKLLLTYVCIVLFILLCVALSSSGTWYSTAITLHWSNTISFSNCFKSLSRGMLSVGTGTGIIVFLSRDAPFRSPANMTSISTSLFGLFVCILFSLIVFSGIKTMSYFHGEEENIIEIGTNLYFESFASVSEILTYYDNLSIWEFAWFSMVFFCLFCNLCVMILFLGDQLMKIDFCLKYKNLSLILLIVFVNIISLPFYCSDLTGSLTDSTEVIQVVNNILFSFSFYWVYGYHNHIIDIIFMIGIKASYFWKIAWVMSPIFLLAILYFRWKDLDVKIYSDSYLIETLSMTLDLLMFYIMLSIYFSIIFIGMLIQLLSYYRNGEIRDVFFPTDDWGPRELVLFKSRKIFVPEIMTTEFLYRQVRIRGYRENKNQKKENKKRQIRESVTDEHDIQWSPLTSN